MGTNLVGLVLMIVGMSYETNYWASDYIPESRQYVCPCWTQTIELVTVGAVTNAPKKDKTVTIIPLLTLRGREQWIGRSPYE